MGIFGNKRKILSHAEKVYIAYGYYRPDMVHTIFPGGRAQAGKIIKSLAGIYGLKLEDINEAQYYEILQTYSDTLIRRVITHTEEELIYVSLQAKHGNFVKNRGIAKQVLAYVVLNMRDNEFELALWDDYMQLNALVQQFSYMEDTAKENAEAERKNLEDADYGLVPKKPIYTHGVNASWDYVNDLKASSGERLSWERLGSTIEDGINGNIDIYQSTLPDGTKYGIIYVNMYGSSNSDKIPAGYVKERPSLDAVADKMSREKGDNSVASAMQYEASSARDSDESNPIVKLPTMEKESTMVVAFCRKCGAKLASDSMFCHKCGTKVVIVEQQR